MKQVRWTGLVAVCLVLSMGVAFAEEDLERKEAKQKELTPEERHAIVNGLEHGIHALRKLGRMELAEHLLEIARDVAHGGGKKAKRNRERAMAERHIEIIKVGVPILIEAGRRDSAELLEHAAHARELTLERRTDAEAMKIRKSAPTHGQLAELLIFAAEHAEKQDKTKQAGWLRELGQHYVNVWKQRAAKRKKLAERPVPEDELGLLRKAMNALLERGKRDRAHRVEQAIHWRELRAEGKGGPEAREARRRAPMPSELAGHLRFAADLWIEWGHEKMGRGIDAFAKRLESSRRDR